MAVKHLSKAYGGGLVAPWIDRVEMDIFRLRYYMACMQCTFCQDSCCQYGVDVDVLNVARIAAQADALEAFTGTPRESWFEPGVEADGEFPGGGSRRTQVKDGRCVFLDRRGRGCLLHAYSLQAGWAYQELKPLVSTLFPLTFDEGLLCPADEVSEKSLVCLGEGGTLYRGARNDLQWYFGPEFIAELDALET